VNSVHTEIEEGLPSLEAGRTTRDSVHFPFYCGGRHARVRCGKMLVVGELRKENAKAQQVNKSTRTATLLVPIGVEKLCFWKNPDRIPAPR
jgi:hypothetical protein